MRALIQPRSTYVIGSPADFLANGVDKKGEAYDFAFSSRTQFEPRASPAQAGRHSMRFLSAFSPHWTQVAVLPGKAGLARMRAHAIQQLRRRVAQPRRARPFSSLSSYGPPPPRPGPR